jgi:hypothetical protein
MRCKQISNSVLSSAHLGRSTPAASIATICTSGRLVRN